MMSNETNPSASPHLIVVALPGAAPPRPVVTAGLEGPELARLCKHTAATDDDALLLAALGQHYPDRDFRLVRDPEEWYRIGGVVDAAGNRVARDITEWTDRAFIECGQNFKTLLRHCRENGLVATRHRGVTLYLVVPLGEGAEQFLQIEIDRSQEVRDRRLVGEDNAPQDLEELIDPLEPIDLDPEPLGPAIYAYRRKTEVALFMEEMGKHQARKHPVQRLMDDWNHSSAGRHRVFCHEWTLRLHQHRGRFAEQKMDVTVMPVHHASRPRLESAAGRRGTGLQASLHHFDKQAGFPFAWFFYMVARLYVPVLIGEAVHQDLDGDFAYLPHRDAVVLKEWIADPYFV
jgi:hypothetical protein